MSLPVEDPVLNASVVIGGLVTSRGKRVDDVGLPIILDEILKVFAIRCLGMRDVVIREPALKLGLMPFVVG